MFSVLDTSVADPLDPVVVREVILLLYAVFQLVWEVVVGMAYPVSTSKANVPLPVIGEPVIFIPVGTVMATEVTVPEEEEVLLIVKFG